MALSKFQLLLNNLSNELTEKNLHSLIHICGIPGGQRDNIKNGWQVFTILLHQDAIGDRPDQLKFLLQIMRQLRPRRRDLVSMVKLHIEQNYEEAETILNDVEFSGEFSFPSSRPPTPILVDDRYSGCLVRAGCFNCSCARCCCSCCCCCAFLAVFFLLLTVTSALVWYTHIFEEVQGYRKKNKYVGPLVTFVFGFTAVSFFLMSVGYYCFQRHCGPNSHTFLSDVDDRTSNQAIHDNSYAASADTRTSCRTSPRKMYRSTSSGRMTASSSLASTFNSYRTPIPPSNLETNGSLRQHGMFITEYDEDRESKEEAALTADGCHASLGDTESLNQQIV